MGKAANRDRNKRIKFLKELAQNNPEKFDSAWKKRLSSWIIQIRKNSKKLNGAPGNRIPPVYNILYEAMKILYACGPDIYLRYAEETYCLLENECIRELTRNWIGPRSVLPPFKAFELYMIDCDIYRKPGKSPTFKVE